MTLDELRRLGILLAATGACFYVTASSFAEPKGPVSYITGISAMVATLYLLVINSQETLPEIWDESE